MPAADLPLRTSGPTGVSRPGTYIQSCTLLGRLAACGVRQDSTSQRLVLPRSSGESQNGKVAQAA